MTYAVRGDRAGFGGPGYSGRSLRLLGAAVAALAAGACYSHTPLQTLVPAPNTRVLAEVTDMGRTTLGNAIGPGATDVDGVVVAADTASWTLALLRVGYRGGSDVAWNREQVTFPRYALTEPKERKFNRRKSWLAAGVITVTALLAARLFGAFGFGEGPNGEPEPPF
ncbi:MAG: hypothetical protein ACREMI_06490 [Gemmatimonadales bacterium]